MIFILSFFPIELCQVLEVLNPCFNIYQRTRKLVALQRCPLKLIADLGCFSFDFVHSPLVVPTFLFNQPCVFQLPSQGFFLASQLFNAEPIRLPQLLQGRSSESLSFEFLDDFIRVNHSRDLFEFAEGFLIVIKFLFLILIIVLVVAIHSAIQFDGAVLPLNLLRLLITDRNVFVEFPLFLIHVLHSHFLHCYSPLLEPLQLSISRFLGMSGIMSQQQKLFEVLFLALQAGFYDGKLAVIAHSLFPQPLHNLLIRLLNGLGFVVLDHDLVKPVLKNPDVPHQWAFFDEAQFIFLYLFQLILQAEQGVLLGFGRVLFFVENPPQKILVLDIQGCLGGETHALVGCREGAALLATGNELVTCVFEMKVFSFEFFYFLSIFLFDLLCLAMEVLPVLVQDLRFLLLLLKFSFDACRLPVDG